jgi:hypothetical protein
MPVALFSKTSPFWALAEITLPAPGMVPPTVFALPHW